LISADGAPGVSVAVSVCAYTLVADRACRSAVAVTVSADVLATDRACRIAVPISVRVHSAIAVNACRITRSIRVKDGALGVRRKSEYRQRQQCKTEACHRTPPYFRAPPRSHLDEDRAILRLTPSLRHVPDSWSGRAAAQWPAAQTQHDQHEFARMVPAPAASKANSNSPQPSMDVPAVKVIGPVRARRRADRPTLTTTSINKGAPPRRQTARQEVPSRG
jgi:hypothetical protein